jgi:hypothetical protein
VGCVHPPSPEAHRSGIDPFDIQLLEAFDTTHDIDHCVNRSDLVECDGVRGDAVDFAFGLRQQPKGLDGVGAHPLRELGLLEDVDQLPKMPVMWVWSRPTGVNVVFGGIVITQVGMMELVRMLMGRSEFPRGVFGFAIPPPDGSLGGRNPAAQDP